MNHNLKSTYYTGWSAADSITIKKQDNIRFISDSKLQTYLELIADIVYHQTSSQNNTVDLDDKRNFNKCADALDTIEDIMAIITDMDKRQYMIYTEFNGPRLIGFTVIRLEKDAVYIQLICSIERGIGTKIMYLVERLALDNNYSRIELHPTKTSMAFYSKLGYSKMHRNKYTGTIYYKQLTQ